MRQARERAFQEGRTATVEAQRWEGLSHAEQAEQKA